MPICGVDYANRLNQLEKPRSVVFGRLTKVLLGGCLLLLLGLGIGNLVTKKRSGSQLAAAAKQPAVPLAETSNRNSNPETMLAVISQDDSPVVQRVAGLGTSQNPTDQESGFGLVTATTQVCSESSIFALGEKETDPSSPPADEFNWVGALEVLPEYPEPFVINVNSSEEFPWRTTLPVAAPITINFEYTGQPQTVVLTLGWAVGNQGSKSIMVALNDETVGKTAKYQAQMLEEAWQYMEQVSDKITFALAPGQHSLTLNPMIESGDAIIWDYIKLETTACDTN